MEQMQTAIQSIGVFGAAFDPPTLGHADVIAQAKPHFDRIVLVPCISHAFIKKTAAFEHRCKMLDLFLSEMKLTNFCGVSIIESDLLSEGMTSASLAQRTPVYTFDVLEALEAFYAKSEPKLTVHLHFIIGPDNVEQWQRFYRHQEIEARWSLFISEQRQNIRSTAVRNLIHNSRRAALSDECLLSELRYFIPEGVARYIMEHRVYRDN